MSDVLRFTRVVVTDAGGSAFEDDEMRLKEQWVAEGTPPMLAGVLSLAPSPVVYLRSSDFDSEPHPAPRLLLEDVSGRGHTTYTVGDPPLDGLLMPTDPTPS